eukprot:scaffold8269_cov122-Isochrysis_galbana.AAC.5
MHAIAPAGSPSIGPLCTRRRWAVLSPVRGAPSPPPAGEWRPGALPDADAWWPKRTRWVPRPQTAPASPPPPAAAATAWAAPRRRPACPPCLPPRSSGSQPRVRNGWPPASCPARQRPARR